MMLLHAVASGGEFNQKHDGEGASEMIDTGWHQSGGWMDGCVVATNIMGLLFSS
jgi:hypothetical protein